MDDLFPARQLHTYSLALSQLDFSAFAKEEV